MTDTDLPSRARRHRRIEVDGRIHHYIAAGTGPPIVLIHGFPQTAAVWNRIIARLVPGFRVIAPSLRGLGGTPCPDDDYDTDSLAADIRAIVEAEALDQPITICGHDLGSHVALAYSLMHRDDVHALVMVGPPPPGTRAHDELMRNPRTWHLAFHAHVEVAHMLINGRSGATSSTSSGAESPTTPP